MEDINNSSEDQQDARGKRQIERSAQYPAITIEDALQFVADIYKNFRNSYAKRSDIIDLIEGSHNRHVAASSYYGFLNREKDTYQVSELYKAIANPLNPTERSKKLLNAFISPNLNKELVEKFDGDQIPEGLVAHLSRFHRITEDAAPKAADVFLRNARYCGVLDENSVLNFQKTIQRPADPLAFVVEIPTPEDKVDVTAETKPLKETKVELTEHQQLPPLSTTQLLLPEMVNSEKVRIRLTGGKFAYLVYPLDLTKRDIAIITKQIEQLELIIE